MAKYLKPQTPLQHYSGDYIYPITSVDQVLTSNGERLNANLISIDLKNSVDSDKVVLGTQITPVNIEGGGTNATNAADARRNLEITPENIGAMKMELLWENASPTSAFSSYTVNLDLSRFSMVRIEYFFHIDYLQMYEHSIPINHTGRIPMIYGIVGHRDATVTNNGVNFSICNVYDNYGGSVTPREGSVYLIPYRIYGIKGVL